MTTGMADETSPPVPRDGKRAVAVPVNGCSATPAPLADDSYREIKRQRLGAPGDQPALAGQSGCGVPAKSTDVSVAGAQDHATHAPEIVQQSRAAGGLPPPMRAAEALAQAEAEELTLVRSSASNSGFQHVTVDPGSKVRPYKASVKRDGKSVHLGLFATAEEVRLHIARTPEGQAAVAQAFAALPPPMTAAEALAQAEAEGLTLVARSDNQSGFRYVSVRPGYKRRPYEVRLWRDGKCVHFGHFATAVRQRCTWPERLRGRLPPPCRRRCRR